MNLSEYFSFYIVTLVDIIEQFNSFSIKILNDYGGFNEE